ncbi:MAG TPA: MMPL family transporter, partial [Kofleriaceae bacterium]|nr:MMPL family transporter [Kofleriaceae bacterium]
VLTALAVALTAPGFHFTTEITRFLPDHTARDEQAGNRAAAGLLASGETARIMVVDLTLGPAAKPGSLQAAAAALVTMLRRHPDVDFAYSGVTDADVAAILEFLSSWPGSTFVPRTGYTDAEIRARLLDLQERLGSPLSVLIRSSAPHDPLGGIWQTLTALRQAQGHTLIDEEGILLTPDRRHAFVFLQTRSSPFDTEAQRAFRAALDSWLATAAPPSARIQTAGAAQFAIASEAQIKGDINRIGVFATVGTVVLFLVLFGSVRLILIGLVPIIFGSAVALVVCHALFGSIHGITLAFGTSLLGLGIDYVEHYYTHFILDPASDPKATMRSVGPSIALGATTTIIGFVGVAASGVAGLREMALFSVVAIAAALVATYFLVPAWMPRGYLPPRSLARLDRAALSLLGRLTRNAPTRRQRAVAIAAALVATGLGVAASRFTDDVNLLLDGGGPELRDEREVRARLGSAESSVFAVATGAGDDALLVSLGRVTGELERARVAGAVGSFVPLGALLPDRAEQVARHAAARAAAPRVRAIMSEIGFVPEQFQPYWDALEAPPALLTLDAVRRSPLAPYLAAWIPSTATPTALLPLDGVKNLADLRARVPSGLVMAPSQTVVALFRGVRTRTLVASGLGLVAIFALLAIRYRNLTRAAVALLPAGLACVATVIVLAAAQVSLTILHVMALLLAVSLAVDFGIFLVEKSETLEGAARTMVSILAAALTTVLSFGLLGISSNPGLASLGITLTLGTTFGMLSCLLAAWWIGQPRLVASSS